MGDYYDELDLGALDDLTVMNDIYEPSWDRPERHLVLCGGSGSGKSIFVAQKHLALAADEGARCMVLRKVRNRCRDSTFLDLTRILHAQGTYDLVDVHDTLMRLRFEGGGFIIHQGMDKAERIKSLSEVDYVWIEEASEFTDEDLKQIDLRVRGRGKKQITYTMNPVDGARRVLRRLGVSEQDFNGLDHTASSLKGRRGGVWVQHTTASDNPFAGEDYEDVLEGMDEEWTRIYRDGKLGSEGSCDQVITHESVKKAVERTGRKGDGIMRMGVDPSRGGDDAAISVFEDTTLIHLERFKIRNVMRVVDRVVDVANKYKIRGRYIAVDAVGVGGPVVDRLKELGYPEVIEVQSGGSPKDVPTIFDTAAKFVDLRAQMWWYVREMLNAGKVSIDIDPDSKIMELLSEDLTAPRYRALSDRKIQVEPKLGYGGVVRRASGGFMWGVRERLGRSTDCGDAFIYGLCVNLLAEPNWLADDDCYDDDWQDHEDWED